MRITRRLVPAAVLVLLVVGATRYGGWVTVTVEDLPDHLVEGQTVPLAFTVRAHGREPVDDLAPRIRASVAGSDVTIAARRVGSGRYAAQLSAPGTGDAQVTIHTGFNDSRVDLVPLRVIARGAKPPRLSAHERGRRLFVAKGCITCHVHDEVAQGRATVPIAPDLTTRRYAAAYLRSLLQDPASMLRPDRAWDMPNLGLKTQEIDALTAFLNDER